MNNTPYRLCKGICRFLLLALVAFVFSVPSASAQQFNSDNYITMPHGTGTFILTGGQRNSTMYAVFAVLPRVEFNVQANLFWADDTPGSSNRFTTNIYGKYTFWINKKNNGGSAVLLGLGHSPGFYTKEEYSPLEKSYWAAVPLTIPFLDGALSWDIMPGANFNLDYGDDKESSWGFTYSTRLAIYKVIPKTAIVGEFYGTEGDVNSKPEYKAGLRWEPNDFIVVAGTYGAQFDGGDGAGFELGIMIFTPQFLKKDYIRNNKIEY